MHNSKIRSMIDGLPPQRLVAIIECLKKLNILILQEHGPWGRYILDDINKTCYTYKIMCKQHFMVMADWAGANLYTDIVRSDTSEIILLGLKIS